MAARSVPCEDELLQAGPIGVRALRVLVDGGGGAEGPWRAPLLQGHAADPRGHRFAQPAVQRLPKTGACKQKMLEDQQYLEDQEAAREAAFNKKAADDAAAAVGAIFKTLEQQATEAMFKNEVGVAIEFDVDAEGGLEHWAAQLLENHLLFEDHEADVKRVQAKGTTICSSCKFSGGCYKCWWPKTARYWRNKETRGKLMEGYAPAAKAAAKAKAAAGKAPAGKAKAVAGKAKAPAGKPTMAGGGPCQQAFAH